MTAGECRGATVVRQRRAEEKQLHDKTMEDGGRRWVGRGKVFIFCGIESYLQSYPLES
jgi:hypothetical protein